MPRCKTIFRAWLFFSVGALSLLSRVGFSQTPPETKEAQNTDKPAVEATLQFSFREQKWIDVLDWFAKQADLSLVVNELPPGGFTYSDTKSYTPTEALDLINGVLSTRGFALIRRERMLICANLSQGIPEGLIPRIELNELDRFGQFELVEVMFPLGRRPAESVSSEVKPLLGAHGSATTLPQTKQMLVTTTAGKMRIVSAIVSSIPEPPAPPAEAQPQPPQPPTLAVYPAKDVDARAAMEMIQTLLAGVKLTADEKSGQINAFATPDQHAVIQKLLTQMSTTTAAELRPRLDVYEISHDTPTALLQQLRLVVPDAILSLDSDPNRLIAFATPDQHEQLQQTMKKLVADGSDPRQVPVVYSLRNTQPAVVAPMIQSLFPRAKVTADAQGGRLVVLANADQQASIRKFVEQLETQDTNRPQIKGYPLDQLNAEQVRTVVSTLVPKAQLTVDNDAKQLVVVASESEHERIADLLRQLAATATPAVQQSLRLYDVAANQRDQFSRAYLQLDPDLTDIKLLDSGQARQLLVLATDEKHQRVEHILAELKTQFPEHERLIRYYDVDARLRERFTSLRTQLAPDLADVQLVTDNADSRMGVVATETQHRQVELLISQLKQDLPAGDSKLKVFAVTPTQRSRFMSLKPLLEKLSSVRVIDESRPQELVIWGTQDQLSQIESLLPSLQSSDKAGQMQLVTYPINQGDPASVQTVLKELYPDTKVIVDAESRRVMVWATPEQHPVLEQAIGQLDAPPAAGKNRMVYYRLGKVNADQVQPLFTKLLPKMSLVADRDTNSIIAWGSDKDHTVLARTVDEFRNQDTDGANSVVSYPSGPRDPDLVRRLLGDLAPRTRIVADPSNRAVIVWGTPDEHQAIEQALREMSRTDDSTDATLLVYPISRLNASNVIPLLREIAPLARIRTSDNGRQLLVWATPGIHTAIKQAIEQIDSPDNRTLETYTLTNATTSQARELISQVTKDVKFLESSQPRELLIQASPPDHQLIRATLEQLEQVVQRPADQQLRVYPLGKAAPDVVTPLLDRRLLDGVSLVADASRNALIVRATEPQHAALSKAIESILQGLPAVRERVSRVYRFTHANPTSAHTTLVNLVPTATFAVDVGTRSLVVAAFPEDHERIQSTVQQLDQADSEGRSTKVYRVRNADVDAASDALRALIPDASISGDEEAHALLVTANAGDQQRVAEVVSQLEKPDDSDLQTRAFRLPKGGARAVRDAIQALLPRATLAADVSSRTLLVTAPENDIVRVEAVLKQMDEANAVGLQTQVYRPQYGDVAAIQTALQALLPDAVLANDPINRVLIATTSPEQHERITATVQQMDRRGSDEPVLQAYAVTQADVRSVHESLKTMYEGNQRVSITFDETNRNILVKAAPFDQQTVAQIVSQMENGAAASEQRRLVMYPANSNDPDSLVRTLRNLFRNQSPAVELSLNKETQQLAAVATTAQHNTLSEAVRQIQREPTVVEVFPLQTADPFAIETAIGRLYANDQSKPIANGDTESQQLFVRGTRRQLDDVRQLLIKMGELPMTESSSQRGVRVIPFRGDVNDAIEQIHGVWSKLRRNRLEIVTPANTEPVIKAVTPRVEISEPGLETKEKPPAADRGPENDSASNRAAYETLPASIQADNESANAPPSEDAAKADDSVPPVVIVPGQGTVTIMSDDEAALNQAEILFRTIVRQNQSDAGAGNFAVYTLSNAGARGVAKLLTELFEQMPITTRAVIGRVSMVADDRLNAVVVHGRPADRAVIAELLRVLDSSNVPDSLANARPKIVPVRYMDADQVLEILRGVYETQLKSGGNRPEIEIPEGISSEVATLLQQLNAASAGPLLTLEVDDVTNSIVVLAPNQLSGEVSLLVKELDENAQQNDHRKIGLVTLRGTNVKNLEDVLKQLLRSGRTKR